MRLRESCEWPPSRPTREFIAVEQTFGRQLRESDALRSPTPRQSSNLGIRFLVDAFGLDLQHLVAMLSQMVRSLCALPHHAVTLPACRARLKAWCNLAGTRACPFKALEPHCLKKALQPCSTHSLRRLLRSADHRRDVQSVCSMGPVGGAKNAADRPAQHVHDPWYAPGASQLSVPSSSTKSEQSSLDGPEGDGYTHSLVDLGPARRHGCTKRLGRRLRSSSDTSSMASRQGSPQLPVNGCTRRNEHRASGPLPGLKKSPKTSSVRSSSPIPRRSAARTAADVPWR